MTTDATPGNVPLSDQLGLVDDGQGDHMDALLLKAKDMICASQPMEGCSNGYTVPAAEWLALQAEVMHRLREHVREGLIAVLQKPLAERDGCDYVTTPGAVCKKCWKVHAA